MTFSTHKPSTIHINPFYSTYDYSHARQRACIPNTPALPCPSPAQKHPVCGRTCSSMHVPAAHLILARKPRPQAREILEAWCAASEVGGGGEGWGRNRHMGPDHALARQSQKIGGGEGTFLWAGRVGIGMFETGLGGSGRGSLGIRGWSLRGG